MTSSTGMFIYFPRSLCWGNIPNYFSQCRNSPIIFQLEEKGHKSGCQAETGSSLNYLTITCIIQSSEVLNTARTLFKTKIPYDIQWRLNIYIISLNVTDQISIFMTLTMWFLLYRWSDVLILLMHMMLQYWVCCKLSRVRFNRTHSGAAVLHALCGSACAPGHWYSECSSICGM